LASACVDQEVEVVKEIDAEDGHLNIGYEEYPPELTAEANVERVRTATVHLYGGAVGCAE
jgi:hypothetical protein